LMVCARLQPRSNSVVGELLLSCLFVVRPVGLRNTDILDPNFAR
jgi:hypothetical protein